ncbi:non-heme iron oxygenase ferredoxin subunit [Bosea sp. BK604]|uniref:non-heme iron oxygenase ferredoxin subunit n=1 Tax=Bosea sp. BK604 TaxID=2512180 RepID=UPI00104DCC3B|nr:non-heme iron oxygenase ferredoxin subunit [Bosea sp. BK604]TCR63159.1 3-phenylpropionate/trans-cinnamate dioxygenase ferredoxin subunit/naphthalene 1,2-dioxygenase system ferredoxin subunit [Bosea sp. BK604]
MRDGDGFVRIASTTDVPENSVIGLRVGEQDIALFHLENGEFRATDNICTHEYALMSEGWLEDCVIECPLHAGRFDVRTGKGLCAPIERDLPVFEVRISGTDVFVKLP